MSEKERIAELNDALTVFFSQNPNASLDDTLNFSREWAKNKDSK